MRIDLQIATVVLLPELIRKSKGRDRRAKGFLKLIRKILTSTDIIVYGKK